MVRQLIDLESFVTLSYARFDLSRRHLDLVDCGHTGMMIVRARTRRCARSCTATISRWGSARERSSTRSSSRSSREICSCSIRMGSRKCATSPESSTARTASRSAFGSTADSSPKALVDAIRNAAVAFAQSDRLTDDLTCVAVKSRRRAATACALRAGDWQRPQGSGPRPRIRPRLLPHGSRRASR